MRASQKVGEQANFEYELNPPRKGMQMTRRDPQRDRMLLKACLGLAGIQRVRLLASTRSPLQTHFAKHLAMNEQGQRLGRLPYLLI